MLCLPILHVKHYAIHGSYYYVLHRLRLRKVAEGISCLICQAAKNLRIGFACSESVGVVSDSYSIMILPISISI